MHCLDVCRLDLCCPVAHCPDCTAPSSIKVELQSWAVYKSVRLAAARDDPSIHLYELALWQVDSAPAVLLSFRRGMRGRFSVLAPEMPLPSDAHVVFQRADGVKLVFSDPRDKAHRVWNYGLVVPGVASVAECTERCSCRLPECTEHCLCRMPECG